MNERSLKLQRPIVCIDLETTGLNVETDRIVEISCVKLLPDGTRSTRTRRLNPTIPISEQATQVHGIRNEDVQNEPTFDQVAKGLWTLLEDCDVTGFNIEQFDLPLLSREFRRVGLNYPASGIRVVDAWRIFMTKEPRDLTAAYRFYCGKTLERAHSAQADADAAADILLAQVQKYADVPQTVDELHEFCHPVHPDWLDPDGRIVWRGDDAVLSFGKNRDRPLRVLVKENPDYLRWIVDSDFSAEVKSIIKAALRGEFPQAPAPLK